MPDVEISESMLLGIGLPTKYMKMDLRDELCEQSVTDLVVRYTAKIKDARDSGISIVLTGPSPCGRTFWLSYLLRFALFTFGNDATYRYITANELTNIAFNDDEKYAALVNATFVGLDDIDATINSGTVQVIGRFLRERHKHQLVTFSAVTLTDQEARALLGAPIWRLLTTDALRIECPGIGDKVATISQNKLKRFLGE